MKAYLCEGLWAKGEEKLSKPFEDSKLKFPSNNLFLSNISYPTTQFLAKCSGVGHYSCI